MTHDEEFKLAEQKMDRFWAQAVVMYDVLRKISREDQAESTDDLVKQLACTIVLAEIEYRKLKFHKQLGGSL